MLTTQIPQSSSHVVSLASGEKVFYRRAGSLTAPTILLLHGYPTSSHQFRNLIPLLATKYQVIAPDLPGFGFTEVPSTYTYNFDNLAKTIGHFIKSVPQAPARYAIYIFDYGAPTGLRLALANPSAVTAIISQNGNAYEEGISSWWDPMKKFWASGSAADSDVLRPFLEIEGTKSQYFIGTPDPSSISPESYTLDQALLDRPGNKEIQLQLCFDYQNNIKLYPEFHEYFRESQVPLLAIWGENDVIFPPDGALAYQKDLPDAEVRLLNAGHFAVESHTDEIASAMIEFLEKNGI